MGEGGGGGFLWDVFWHDSICPDILDQQLCHVFDMSGVIRQRRIQSFYVLKQWPDTSQRVVLVACTCYVMKCHSGVKRGDEKVVFHCFLFIHLVLRDNCQGQVNIVPHTEHHYPEVTFFWGGDFFCFCFCFLLNEERLCTASQTRFAPPTSHSLPLPPFSFLIRD